MQSTFTQARLHSAVLREFLRYGYQKQTRKVDQLTTWSTAMKPASYSQNARPWTAFLPKNITKPSSLHSHSEIMHDTIRSHSAAVDRPQKVLHFGKMP
jgi:hypothetical protein